MNRKRSDVATPDAVPWNCRSRMMHIQDTCSFNDAEKSKILFLGQIRARTSCTMQWTASQSRCIWQYSYHYRILLPDQPTNSVTTRNSDHFVPTVDWASRLGSSIGGEFNINFINLQFPLRLDYGRSPHAYVNQRLQIQLELMVSGMPLETCWAFSERWDNKF